MFKDSRNSFSISRQAKAKLVLLASCLLWSLYTAEAQTSRTFTTSGSFIAPAGVTSVTVECWGGGGGGGNASHTGNGTSRGGGGAGGSFARKAINVTGGSTYTVTVGSGGSSATVGGDSWFGSAATVLAKGGAAGVSGNKSNGSGGTYGASPAGNIGDQIYLGGAGGNSGTSGSGGGGGGAGSGAVGKAASNNTAGGTTATNGGAGGAGVTATANGNPGSGAASNFGGGGSGAVTTANGGSQTGGAGRQGLVIVSWTSCPTYSLTSLTTTTVCGTGNSATVILSGNAANLPTGTYTVSYNLTGANTATAATATMTVTSAGNGSFTTAALNTAGSTTVTITQLQSGGANGCTSTISTNNVTTFTVGATPTASITGTATGCGSVSLTASGGATYLWNGGSTNTSASNTFSASGTYTVTVTSSVGCTATASQAVTVNAFPTAAISGTTTACGSVTLTASGGNTYVWSGGSATTSAENTFAASGTYTVTVTSAAGCTDTETTNIIVNAAPTVSISGTSTGCGSVTLTASGSGTFLWNGGNATTNATNTFIVSGNYQVVVTAANGCTASASQLVTISPGPSAVNAGSDGAICSGASTVLNGSAIGALLCNDSTTYSASPGASIPDNNLTGITSTINVPASCGSAGEIVSVTLSISHTYTADLDIYLKSPAGDSIALALDQGGAGDGFNGAVFRSNGAALSTIPTTAPATGSYVPQQAFANLGSSGAAGNWTLRIIDDAAQDLGTLTSWSIEVKSIASSNSPVTYSWSPATGLSATNIAVPTATPSSTTTYTLTATSAGCSVTDQVVVTVNEKPIAPAAGNASSCGSGAVTISATPSAGATIDWYAGATGGTTLSSGSSSYTSPSISFTTVYFAEARNILTGCVSETRTAVSATVNSVPTASISNNNGLALSCAIPSTTLTASGGSSYLWSVGATTAGIDVTTSGTFTVTVTGSNGCTATTSASTSLDNTPPAAGITNNTGSSVLTCSRTSISLTATGGGLYSWNNSLGSNATVSITSPGTYSVTVTSGNGCTNTETIEITQNISAPIASISNNNGLALSCAIPSTTLTASGGSSYVWSTGATTAGIDVTTFGTLTVTVTGSNGCTASTSASTSLDNTPPTAGITNNTGSNELTCSRTSISLTATGGGLYSWNNSLGSSATVSLSSPGTYSVTVTSGNGCTDTETIEITQNISAPIASISNNNGLALSCTIPSTTLTASGGSPYVWNTGATTAGIDVTTSGTFTVTVTGSNGCTATTSASTSLDNTPPAAGITNNTGSNELTCSRTSISLTATGGGLYSWDNSLGSNATVSITSPGTYSVTVTSGNGCTDTETIEITQNISAPVASMSNNNGLALSCAIPSTTLTASGGSSYLWSTGATTAGIDVTTSGTFTVTVTGSNGCTATTIESTTLDNKAPTAEIQNNTGAAELNCIVSSINLTAIGGISYNWSTGATTSTLTVFNQGTYTVIVTGLNGCTASESINLTSNQTAPSAIITPAGSTTICAGSAVGLQASSGTSYLWSSGAQTQGIQATGGSYTVTVTGSNGCTAVSSSVTVTEESQIQANAGTDQIDCDGTFNLSANSPGNLNSNWSVVSGTAIINNIASPNSTVTLNSPGSAVLRWTISSAACGTTSYDEVTLNLPYTQIQGNIIGTASQCIDANAGSAQFSFSSNINSETYYWTVPAGMNIVSGAGSNQITVSWPAGAASRRITGQVCVTVSNACSTAAPICFTINYNSSAPVSPGSISGAAKLCPGNSQTFSVGSVIRAEQYEWILPTGLSINSGNGTNVIGVTANADFLGGTVSVRATNACGSGNYRNKSLGLNMPLTPAVISGPVNGLCALNNVSYSTNGTASATKYQWTIPTGASINGSDSGSAIVVNYGNSSGSITVRGVNTCGTGNARSVSVSVLPARPVSITGSTTPCAGQTYLYGTASIPSATSYNWSIPSGAVISSGPAPYSKEIQVAYGSLTATNQLVTVSASNACGTGSIRTLSGINISSCGSREAAELSEIKTWVYPTPTAGQFHLALDALHEEQLDITLCNLFGQIIHRDLHSVLPGAQVISYDLHGQKSGVYLLKIRSGTAVLTLRVLLQP